MKFDSVELRRLDGTLLLVFLGLMRHRKATLVAGQLGLTPSTISHALSRLRDAFGDPLFLRRSDGLEPTAVARAIDEPVRRAVEELERALRGGGAFEPSVSTDVLRLGAYDLDLSTLLPPLMRHLLDEAPGMRVISRSTGRRDALAALSAGEIDLALGLFENPGRDYLVEPLFEEGFAVLMRQGEAPPGGVLGLDRYLAARHLVVSPGGDLNGIVDDLLRARGLARRVVLAVPLFLPALAAAAETGLLATVPRRLAEAHGAGFGLVGLDPPLPVRHFTISAVRHRRDAHNGMIDWVVNAVRQDVRRHADPLPSQPS